MHHRVVAYTPIDFAIFYCAGDAAASGTDPYRIEPLRACERRLWPKNYLVGFAEPAAVPGYALPLFGALARLPFDAAKYLWLLSSCLAFGVSVLALQKVSRLHVVAVFALLFPYTLLNVHVGQLGPFFVAALSVSLWCVVSNRHRLAAFFALLSLIEPHVGLAAVIGLFCFAPRARTTIVVGGVILAALHFAILGPSVGLQYFTSVLPAMMHAESVAADQYGTVWFLHQAGLSERAAQTGATSLYIAALGAGLLLAAGAARVSRNTPLIVAMPVCISLLFAPFLHDIELCSAFVGPLAAMHATKRKAVWAIVALLIAIPWFAALHDRITAASSIVSVFLFALFTLRGPLKRSLISSAGSAAAVAVFLALLNRLPIMPSVAQPATNLPVDAYSAQSWGLYLRTKPDLAATGARVVIVKGFNLLALCVFAVLATRRYPRRHKSRSDETIHGPRGPQTILADRGAPLL
jgi:hypothetical protein